MVATAQPQVDLSATDPNVIREALKPFFGEELAGLIRAQVADAIKGLGLTEVDRRHLAIPETRVGMDETRSLRLAQNPDLKRELMRRWFRAVLFGKAAEFGDDNEYFQRTLSTTDAAGGYLIPPEFLPEVVRDVPKLTALYQYVRRWPVGANSGEMPSISTNASVSWGTENTAMSEGDPVFGQATYSVNRMNVIAKLSREIGADSNPGIVDVITSLFQEAIAEERDKVIAIGSGSGKPTGIYSATGITDVTGVTSLTYANLVDLHETVDERYFSSPSCRWVFNQRVKEACMKLTDSYGQPIFVVDKSEGFKPRMFGHGVSIESSCPNNFIFFGDLRYYLWFDRQEAGVERTTEGGDAFAKHQLWIKFWERVDGKPVLPPTVPMARARLVTGIS